MGQRGTKHKPTKELKKRVEDMSVAGMPQEKIAKRIGISEDTLRKYYAEHLESGVEELGRLAIEGLRDKLRNKNTAAIFFVLKCRFGWRETAELSVSIPELPDLVINPTPPPAEPPEAIQEYINGHTH